MSKMSKVSPIKWWPVIWLMALWRHLSRRAWNLLGECTDVLVSHQDPTNTCIRENCQSLPSSTDSLSIESNHNLPLWWSWMYALMLYQCLNYMPEFFIVWIDQRLILRANCLVSEVLRFVERPVAEEGGGDDVFLRVIGMSNSRPTTRPPCEGVTRTSPSGTTWRQYRRERWATKCWDSLLNIVRN